jgi:fimbrial isopeptide formation D2 family protein/LPXTG-motif cell wall-anchored protein
MAAMSCGEKSSMYLTPSCSTAINESYTDATTASIGDSVQFQLEATIPNMQGYKHYQYAIEDTLSSGLTFDESTLVIKYGESTLTKKTEGATDWDYEVVAPTTSSNKVRIIFHNFLNKYLNKDGKFVVTYSATVNDTAYTANEKENNAAALKFSNDPTTTGKGDPDDPDDPSNTSVTGTTPEKKVYIYSTSIRIHKVDASNNNASLAGAEFALYNQDGSAVTVTKMRVTEGTAYVADKDGTYYKLTDGSYTTTDPTTLDAEKDADALAKYVDKKGATKYKQTSTTLLEKVDNEGQSDYIRAEVDANGYLTFKGLAAGSYTLEETKKPSAQYNDIDKINFIVTFHKDDTVANANANCYFGVNQASNDAAKISVSTDKKTLTAVVYNTKGTTLPSTGGMGTTILYVVGAALAIAASILLVTKKRMSAAK